MSSASSLAPPFANDHDVPGEPPQLFDSPTDSSEEDFDRIAAQRPRGALALCLLSVAVILGIWFAFYFLAFLPRGILR